MTDIQPISSNASTLAAETPSTSDVARAALTDNLDTFLTLLTKQLQNQDPLQPMDTNQFVDQLTQFSELEQGVEGNKLLEDISASLKGDGRQSDIGLLGREVEAETNEISLTSESGALFSYQITAPTEEAEMRIFDQSGSLVARFDVDGDLGRYDAGWDGRTTAGGYASPGVYRAEVVAKSDSDQERLAGQVLSGGVVKEVRFESDRTNLILANGLTVTSDQIQRVGVASDAN